MYQMQAINICGLAWLATLSKYSASDSWNCAISSIWGSVSGKLWVGDGPVKNNVFRLQFSQFSYYNFQFQELAKRL
jgi:hypothetical protein